MSSIQLFKVDPDSTERELLGSLTEKQLRFLVNHLEEEFEEDVEYYVDQATIDYLQEEGADRDLLDLLEEALADADDGVEIAYQTE